MKKQGIILRSNHFDPTWRRCWDRYFNDNNRCFVSYRDIQKDYYDDAIESTKDGKSCFMSETSWSIRHYLKTRPEMLDVIKKLAKENRFELLGAGENIVDSNMISSELLIRNWILGCLWGRNVIEKQPVTGWYMDGFGSSAQIPQILRGCDIKWLASMHYNLPDAPYWQGLDGSIVYTCTENIDYSYPSTHIPFKKHSPCEACKGEGCSICCNRGYLPHRAEFDNPPKDTDVYNGNLILALLSGEEILPSIDIGKQVDNYNNSSENFFFRQGIFQDIHIYLKKELDQVDNPPEYKISSKVENNPCQTGCYVSRIKAKQTHRANENYLLSVECWDTMLNNSQNHDKISDLWRDLSFTGFHDAITSTHIDPAYDELMDIARDIKKSISSISSKIENNLLGEDSFITVFNHNSFPITKAVAYKSEVSADICDTNGKSVLIYDHKDNNLTFLAENIPAFGTKVFSVMPEKTQDNEEIISFETGMINFNDYILDVTNHGIKSIKHKKCGMISDDRNFFFGEGIIESDIGDPWCTRHTDRTRDRLSRYTNLKNISRTRNQIIISYTGKHPLGLGHMESKAHMIYDVAWEQRFILRQGIDNIDIETDVKWHSQNCRLRLAFPSITKANEGYYDIPAGIIHRERYEHTGNDSQTGAGDWSCVNWASIETPKGFFTLLNKGTPSTRIEDGVLFSSVLRSPSLPAWLHEPFFYTAFNFNNINDQGNHTFKHSFVMADSLVHAEKLGLEFNSKILMFNKKINHRPFVNITSKNTLITSIKRAEENPEYIILRLIEYAGYTEEIFLEFTDNLKEAFLTNLIEDNKEELIIIEEKKIKLLVNPHKIVTLKVKLDK